MSFIGYLFTNMHDMNQLDWKRDKLKRKYFYSRYIIIYNADYGLGKHSKKLTIGIS